LKNSKLSVLWHQYPEVPGFPPRFRTLICSAYQLLHQKTARRFQLFSGGSGLGQFTGKSRRKRGSQGNILRIRSFTPLRVTYRVNHSLYLSRSRSTIAFHSPFALPTARCLHPTPPSPSSLSPAIGRLLGADTISHARCRSETGSSSSNREILFISHRRPPKAVQDRSRHCSSASSTSHPPPCCLEGFCL
jgi:hypothetical protein